MKIITSRQNPLVQELKALRKEASSARLFLEGPRLIEEAVRSGISLETLVVIESSASDIPESVLAVTQQLVVVSPQVYDVLSDLETPPGILAIAPKPSATWEKLLVHRPAPLVILDGIQDPGNAATIARSAEAAGAAGLITTPGTARLFTPKALRGAMGSTLRLPCLEHQAIQTISAELSKVGYALLGAHAKGEAISYTKVDWSKAWALVLGQEGQGLSSDWEPLIRSYVVIPMKPPVESLNVGAAAAILLFESARQIRQI